MPMKALTLAIVAVVVALPGAASAGRPRVALLQFEGDPSGEVQDAVQESIDTDTSVVGPKEVNRTVDKLGLSEDLSDRDLRKLASELDADAIVQGKVAKQGSHRVAKLKLFVHGKKKGFSVEFANAKSEKLRTTLREKLLEKITGEAPPAAAGGDDEGDKKSAKKKKSGDEDEATADDKKSAKKKKKGDEEEAAADDKKSKKKKKGAGDDAEAKKASKDDEAADDKKSKKKRGGDEEDVGAKADKANKTDEEPKNKKIDLDEEAALKKKTDTDEEPKKKADEPPPGDDDKPRKSKKRTARGGDDDEEAGVRASADDLGGGPAHAANRIAVRADVGVSVTTRNLKFTSRTFDQAPKGYQNTPVPGIRVSGEIYPLAFQSPNSPAAGFGLAGEFDKTLGLSLQSTAQPGTKFPVAESRWAIGARYRLVLGAQATAPSVSIAIDYGARRFHVDRAQLMTGNVI